jgi:hypothetical protein
MRNMPIYDVECKKCGYIEERIILWYEKVERCKKCNGQVKLLIGGGRPNFKLVYDNKKDMVDWDGNKSRYWDEYKRQKAEGKKVRIPELDGEKR